MQHLYFITHNIGISHQFGILRYDNFLILPRLFVGTEIADTHFPERRQVLDINGLIEGLFDFLLQLQRFTFRSLLLIRGVYLDAVSVYLHQLAFSVHRLIQEDCDGRVLYDPVIIYPPGTPVACPGEILTVEVISYISDAIGRGEKVTGVDDEGLVRVELNHAK